MRKVWWIGVALLPAWIAPMPVHSQTQAASAGADLTGQWQGTLQQGNGQRTVLKISKDGG